MYLQTGLTSKLLSLMESHFQKYETSARQLCLCIPLMVLQHSAVFWIRDYGISWVLGYCYQKLAASVLNSSLPCAR